MQGLKIDALKEFLYFNIPLGVFVVCLILVAFIYNGMYKKIKESFDRCMEERAKMIADLSRNNESKDYRIKFLEKQLNKNFSNVSHKSKKIKNRR